MGETSNAAKGSLGILIVFGIAGCVFSGGYKQPDGQPIAETSTPAPPNSEALVANGESKSPMTEVERLTLVEIDPELKQASDFLGLLINTNGHLCAKVSNVEPVSGTKFEVTCVQYRNGSGRVRYLVDGTTNEATPL